MYETLVTGYNPDRRREQRVLAWGSLMTSDPSDLVRFIQAM